MVVLRAPQVTTELGDHLGGTLAFMFETRYLLEPTAYAQSSPALDRDYDAAWSGFTKAKLP